MSRTKNRNQKRATPTLIIKNNDGMETKVHPVKAWNPGDFRGVEVAPGFVAHVTDDVQPETLTALAQMAEAALKSQAGAGQGC